MRFTTALVSALLATVSLAVDTADINGIAFIDSNSKDRLQMIGIDYQPGGQSGFDPNTGKDVLSDGDACLRDAVLMQKLGVNTVRVYNVNPQTNHDLCMSIFNAAGIYVILDVNSPFMSINRADPASSYNLDYLTYIFSQVENFKGYPNTLGFFSANEVINDIPSAGPNPPYIRAVQRDLRQYIAKHSSRHIPVGYSAADVRDVLQDTWQYLQCAINGDSNDQSRSEFFGLNSYSWCGADATFTSAGYDTLVSMFQSTTIPVFFSEYGCNKPVGTPRVFNEVQALYGANMTEFNGGLVYQWTQDVSKFGLVSVNDDGSVALLQDYVNLQGQYNKLDKSLLTQVPSVSNSIPKCDPSLISSAGLNSTWTIPDQPAGADSLISNGVSKAVQGKIVTVSNTNVKQKVTDPSGKQITGLALNKQSGSNLPSGQSTTSGNANNSSGKKNTGAAFKVHGGVTIVALIAALSFAMW